MKSNTFTEQYLLYPLQQLTLPLASSGAFCVIFGVLVMSFKSITDNHAA